MTEGQVKQRCVANLEIIHICRDSHAQLCDLSGVGPIKGKLEQSKAFSPESKTNWGGKVMESQGCLIAHKKPGVSLFLLNLS